MMAHRVDVEGLLVSFVWDCPLSGVDAGQDCRAEMRGDIGVDNWQKYVQTKTSFNTSSERRFIRTSLG